MKRLFQEMRRTVRAMKSGSYPYLFDGGLNWNHIPGNELRDLMSKVMQTI